MKASLTIGAALLTLAAGCGADEEQAVESLTMVSPGGGQLVGPAGVAVAVRLTTSSPAPATVDLLVDGVSAGSLERGLVGADVTYAGIWRPVGGSEGTRSMKARATIDGRELESAPVSVTVDTLPPVIQNGTAACPGGCKRDGVMNLVATVTDVHLDGVTYYLDLDPNRPVPAGKGAGDSWSVSVALTGWPFPHYEKTVQVTVRAADRAGNEATTVLPVDVTRLRWAYTSGATAVTSPAIMADGTIVFGVSATSGQLRGIRPDMGEALPPLTLGGLAVSLAPTIGPTAIWVASQAQRIYAVAKDGSGILNGTGCETLTYPAGVPALLTVGRDVALIGNTDTLLFAARVAPAMCNSMNAGESFTTSLAVALDGTAYGVTRSGIGNATLRRFGPGVGGFPVPGWTASAGTNIVAPLALDAQGRILLSSLDGRLYRATDQGTSGSVALFATLPAQAEGSPIVMSNDDVVVGVGGGTVHRIADDGRAVWSQPPDVGSTVRGLAALSPGVDGADVLATTALGEFAALTPDGTIAWSTKFSVAPLSFPSVVPAAPGGLPTAYAGSQDGKLYAIVVDGPPDTAAPWPKAHRDLANTANASSPLP